MLLESQGAAGLHKETWRLNGIDSNSMSLFGENDSSYKKGYANACVSLAWIKNKIAGLVSLFKGIPEQKAMLLTIVKMNRT